jgi:hypothetical protein
MIRTRSHTFSLSPSLPLSLSPALARTTHARRQKHTCARARARTHTHTPTHTHARTHTHTRTHAHTHPHPPARAHPRAHPHPQLHTAQNGVCDYMQTIVDKPNCTQGDYADCGVYCLDTANGAVVRALHCPGGLGLVPQRAHTCAANWPDHPQLREAFAATRTLEYGRFSRVDGYSRREYSRMTCVQDSTGSGCQGYTSPVYCGGYDTATFQSVTMCCACGGGSGRYPLSTLPVPSQ